MVVVVVVVVVGGGGGCCCWWWWWCVRGMGEVSQFSSPLTFSRAIDF